MVTFDHLFKIREQYLDITGDGSIRIKTLAFLTLFSSQYKQTRSSTKTQTPES